MLDSRRYRILRTLARGGSSEVLEVVGGAAGQHFALKRPLPALAADVRYAKAFLDEARIGNLLRHPNIARVLDCGSLGGLPCQLMELVDGVSAHALCEQSPGAISTGAALEIVIAVARALEYAHDATDEEGRPLGIVHRDVAPDNVLISWSGEVKLIDFGIALAHRRLVATEVGIIKGKLSYMAPEQFEARDVDRRADVFSAGCLLHYLLTGRSAVQGRAAMDEGAIQIDPALGPDLVDLIGRATRSDRARRLQSAQDLRVELEQLLAKLSPVERGEPLTAVVKSLERTRAEPEREEPETELISELKARPTLAPTEASPRSSSAATKAMRPSRVLANIQVLEPLHRSAGAAIHAGRHGFLGAARTVVLLDPGRMAPERFAVAARLLSETQSPHVFGVLDSGLAADGTQFLITEALSGKRLQAVLEEQRPIDPRRAARWLRELALACQALSEAGLAVPELDPANVFIDSKAGRESLRILPVDALSNEPSGGALPRTLLSTILAAVPSEALARSVARALSHGEHATPTEARANFLAELSGNQTAPGAGRVGALGWRELVAAVGLALGMFSLALALWARPGPPKEIPAAPAFVAARGASSSTLTASPELEPERERDRESEPSAAARRLPERTPPERGPRSRPKESPAKAPKESAPELVRRVDRALLGRGLDLVDLRGTSAEALLDDYLGAKKQKDVAALSAVVPELEAQILAVPLSDALLKQRLKRLGAALREVAPTLADADRAALEQALLDLKTDAEPGLSQAAIEGILRRASELEAKLRR